ncbi:MAG: hypothetical protein K6D38_03015 [Pseudobutyrivibrio sp.]|nr:hypothetical protein [Pseudobutyrivibrio sp.]
MAGAVILYLSFRNNGKDGWFDKTSVKYRFAVITFIAMFCNLMGYGINLKLFVNRYNFVNMEGMVWGKGSGSWLKTFKWYFDSFGYTDFSTKEVFSLGGIGAGCGLLLGSAVGIIKCNVAHPLRANQDFAHVINCIEEKGYTKGVASFWRSQVVAELTNGQVEMWTMNDEYDDVFLWLQYNSHSQIPTGEFFGLYLAEDTQGVETFRKTSKLDEELVYDDGKYVIYQYNN